MAAHEKAHVRKRGGKGEREMLLLTERKGNIEYLFFRHFGRDGAFGGGSRRPRKLSSEDWDGHRGEMDYGQQVDARPEERFEAPSSKGHFLVVFENDSERGVRYKGGALYQGKPMQTK